VSWITSAASAEWKTDFLRSEHVAGEPSRVSAGIVIPPKWSREEAQQALDHLNAKWVVLKDLDEVLDQWAEWADRELGF